MVHPSALRHLVTHGATMDAPSPSPRTRHTLRLVALGVAVAAAACQAPASTSDAVASEPTATQPEWLAALDAPHRMLFDVNAPGTGVAVAHVANWYNGWNAADGSTDAEINGILTFYGGTTLHGLTDEMWSKYGLGELSEQMDAQGTPYTTNPWRTAPLVGGNPFPGGSIETLGERGVTFLLCNNALTFWANQVATARGLDSGEVYADMAANILPEVTLIPAMVVAIDRAQQAGISYHRQ